ncbi:hypothetical protein CUMW_277170 [Citrus unshiu]|uniref:Disease resistance protein At4g27190-like leucine-rich repeats domain-containing protein n=1 Tax=Citrus unshiu TaxID=55188 RepID=A0A2H5N4R2_CITUN|nr:hypothetical protein CUMW_277170 [Citrus unshiu]
MITQVFLNLEKLRVDEKRIGLFPEDWLCKLKCLDVRLDESSTILSLDDFLQRFHTIKILLIEGHDYVLGQSFENLENGMKAMMRGINQRRELKQIFKQESTNTNNLEQLEIFYCYNLTNLVPSSTSFQNLTTLKVSGCRGMINVLTSSTARSLVRLRQMEIGYCKMITEIVADEDDEGDNYAAKDEIVFSELKELILWNLESLTSFSCSGNNCDFKFPSLETLVVADCPNMKIFSEGELSTPKLHEVQMSLVDKKLGAWDRDLNTTIQYVYLKRKKEGEEKENEKSAEANEKEKDAKNSGKINGRVSKLMKTTHATCAAFWIRLELEFFLYIKSHMVLTTCGSSQETLEVVVYCIAWILLSAFHVSVFVLMFLKYIFELSLSAFKVADLDIASKSDSLWQLCMQEKEMGSWSSIGRTEVIMNILNPAWNWKGFQLLFQFEIVQPLCSFVCMMWIPQMLKLEDQDFLGEASCVLSEDPFLRISRNVEMEFCSYLQDGEIVGDLEKLHQERTWCHFYVTINSIGGHDKVLKISCFIESWGRKSNIVFVSRYSRWLEVEVFYGCSRLYRN